MEEIIIRIMEKAQGLKDCKEDYCSKILETAHFKKIMVQRLLKLGQIIRIY
jgi:hypothetical protein